MPDTKGPDNTQPIGFFHEADHPNLPHKLHWFPDGTADKTTSQKLVLWRKKPGKACGVAFLDKNA